MTQQLYEQMMDTQEGVVHLLLEEMAQQRIKEYLLAYALLLTKGKHTRLNTPACDGTWRRAHCMDSFASEDPVFVSHDCF